MPYTQDFSRLSGRGTLTVRPRGWKDEIPIEYGYEEIGRVSYLNWRVKGTSHTFKISYYDIMTETAGDYDEHIQWVLENFRKDYLDWIYEGLTETWMREYYEQYKNLIEF